MSYAPIMHMLLIRSALIRPPSFTTCLFHSRILSVYVRAIYSTLCATPLARQPRHKRFWRDSSPMMIDVLYCIVLYCIWITISGIFPESVNKIMLLCYVTHNVTRALRPTTMLWKKVLLRAPVGRQRTVMLNLGSPPAYRMYLRS
jgi:hypothetical protein